MTALERDRKILILSVFFVALGIPVLLFLYVIAGCPDICNGLIALALWPVIAWPTCIAFIIIALPFFR